MLGIMATSGIHLLIAHWFARKQSIWDSTDHVLRRTRINHKTTFFRL
jgi:hypothetical protein